MSRRTLLLVSLWLREGQVEAFEAFAVHIVSFPDPASLAAYRADDALRALAAQREKIFARTVIVEGSDAGPY